MLIPSHIVNDHHHGEIRHDKIATVLKDLMVGELGELDDDLRAEVNTKLAALFRL